MEGTLKTCTKCGELKSLDNFYDQKKKDGSYTKMYCCKSCHSVNTANHLENMSPEKKDLYYEKMRERYLSRTFGITIADYENLYEAQNGVCAVCGKPETGLESKSRSEVRRVKRLAVDHDHDTGRIRGLLCWKCNTRLGYFESQHLVSKLTAYLETEES